MTFLGLSQGSTVLIMTLLEGLSRMSWQALFLGGSCPGALGVILISLVFLLKDREMFALVSL